MKIVKTAAVGSFVAMVGAGGLWWFAPVVLQGVVEVLTFVTYRPGSGPISDCTNQLAWPTGWSAVSAMAFAAGLTAAVGGLACANRSYGVSALGRPLLFLAAAVAMAAATLMLDATGRFYCVLRTLTTTDTTFTAEQLHGSLYLGFALLPGVAGSLLAASFTGTSKQPHTATSGRLMAMNVGLTIFVGLVFAAAFVLSWMCARHFCWLIASHEPVRAIELGSILYAIVAAQLIASVCLVVLSVTLGGLACMLRGIRVDESLRAMNCTGHG